jgi:hypothetical protein
LIKDVELIDEHLQKIRNKIFKEFKNLDFYEICLEKLKKEKELKDVFTLFKENDNIKDRLALFDSQKFEFEKEVIAEIKCGIIMENMMEHIKSFKNAVALNLDQEAKKLFNKDDKSNPNLVNFNVELELEKEDFKQFVYENLNLDGKLEELLAEKKKNEAIINSNKQKIKSDEKVLLENFICVKCHLRERNAVSKQCPHLMLCDECIKFQKLCPRCGVNIESYDKVFRS